MYQFAVLCGSTRASKLPGHPGFDTVSVLIFSEQVKTPLFSVLDIVPFVGTHLFSLTKRQMKYLAQSCQLYFGGDVNEYIMTQSRDAMKNINPLKAPAYPPHISPNNSPGT